MLFVLSTAYLLVILVQICVAFNANIVVEDLLRYAVDVFIIDRGTIFIELLL